jgi:hypothetical protein
VKSGSRKRAVGTRDRVISHLAAVGEITDPNGMASTSLAAAVGYPGSSVAFAQLLSGMEHAELIEREIRGKRTYRIALAGAAGAGAGAGGRRAPRQRPPGNGGQDRPAPASTPASGGGVIPDASAGTAPEPGGFDYDELARRLLVQVVQRLAAPPGAAAGTPATGGTAGSEGAGSEPAGGSPAGAAGPAPEQAGTAAAVAGLEQKLASIQSRQHRLTAENVKLREQLHEANQSLAEAQERAGAGRGRLDTAEIRLLERLLSPLREQGGRQKEAGTG